MEATGWYIALGMVTWLALFAVWLVGLVFVVRGWIWVETDWLRSGKARAKPFDATAQVDIGEDGFSVEGLGRVEWIDVLTIEGIPDSDSYLIVHTRPFRKLMLTAPVDELARVLNHYLELKTAAPPARGGHGAKPGHGVLLAVFSCLDLGRLRAGVGRGHRAAVQCVRCRVPEDRGRARCARCR
jgi:hypothetical protein